jgi:hypothetical protein
MRNEERSVITDDFPRFDDSPSSYEPLYPPPFEPQRQPGGPVIGAALRYWWVILLAILAFAAAAVALSMQRQPTYKAESRLNVGGFNISAQSLPGFAGGAYLLANAYSRSVYSDAVLKKVGRELGRSRAYVASAVTASPVEDSPIIRVEAESKSKGEAIAMANSAADHLEDRAEVLARSNPDSKRLFKEFQEASRDYRRAVRRVLRARRTRENLERAETQYELARLKRNSTASLYQTSLGGQATTNAVHLLSPARGASSDERAFLERLLAAAILGGFAFGLALAYLLGRNRMPGRIRP